MAGRNSAGKLTSNRFRIDLARSEDDDAIRRLLRENPMEGRISISLEREPSYHLGMNIADAKDNIVLIFSEMQLVCMGKCSYRSVWIDDKIQRIGYLGELRLNASAHGRSDILRRGYRFFNRYRKCEPDTLYITSIASDNHRARRLLEKNARGFPTYQFLSEFVTLVVSVPRNPRQGKLRLKSAKKENTDAVVALLQRQAQRHQLATAWSPEMLWSLSRHGLPFDNIYLLYEGDEIIGCGALWDQRAYRQTKVHRYSGMLRFARPVVNLARWVRGFPPLPRTYSVLKQAFVSPLAFNDGSDLLLPDFLSSLFSSASARDLEFLVLGFPANDDRLKILRKQFSTRSYVSRLYAVSWPGEAARVFHEETKGFLPDVALL